MKTICVSASYIGCRNNFVITGIEEGTGSYSELQKSFTSVIMNILQRANPAYPSKYLEEKFGPIPANLQPFSFIRNDGYVPQWHNTIKGAENGFNPAKELFYDVWPQYLKEFDWVRQLLIPEAPVDKLLDDDPGKWVEQCVDFYLPLIGKPKGLVIEVDGSQHQDYAQRRRDEERDSELKKHGIEVRRIKASDIHRRNEGLYYFMQDLRHIITPTAEELSVYLDAGLKPEYETALQYEDVIRSQLLILHLIDNRVISLDDTEWCFHVFKTHEEMFRLAANDLFEWYDNLYGIKGLKFEKPRISFRDTGLPIHLLPFARPDETIYDGITVMTDAWDAFDYFTVKCAKTVNYDIPWPMQDDDPRISCLIKLLSNIFCEKTEEGVNRYNGFKPGQLPILVNILNRRKTIGILPTGGGKSLCYQFACMLQPAVSFSVCPIMALQKDQKDNLDSLGVTRTEYISGLKEAPKANIDVSKMFGSGKYFIIWVSPERFQTEVFRNDLSRVNTEHNFAYAIIDEVHCLSEWGHDFRTSYLTLIPTIERYCPQATLVGLTATASSAVLKDLKCEFGVSSMDVRAMQSLERKNLKMSVIMLDEDDPGGNDKLTVLHKILDEEYSSSNADRQGIVFTTVRDKTGDTDARSKSFYLLKYIKTWYPNIKSNKFHAGLSVKDKLAIQNQFMKGNVNILSATKAFGIGLNKKDVRYTVHFGLPWSVEAFYQEAGRAGRDGEDSNCYIIYNPIPKKVAKGIKADRLFAKGTTVDEISEIQSAERVKGTDLSTIFYLWARNNKGTDKDLENLKILLDQLKTQSKRIDSNGRSCYRLEVPDRATKPGNITSSDAELALYRLKLLGVVDDWIVEFHPYGDNVLLVYLCKQITKESVRECLLRYIRRTDPDFPREDREEDAKYITIMGDKTRHYIVRYSDVLIRWTYDHIIYSRRQAIYHIKQFCEEFTTPEEFRARVDNFLAINETSVRLDYIVSGDADWPEWFDELSYYVADPEDPAKRKERTVGDYAALRDQVSRYRESYSRITGLNLIYVLSGALSGRFNSIVDTDVFQDVIADICGNQKIKEEDKKEILKKTVDILSERKDSIGDEVLGCFSKVLIEQFPNQARELNERFQDSYSTAYLLRIMTKEIKTSIGGAKWLMKH